MKKLFKIIWKIIAYSLIVLGIVTIVSYYYSRNVDQKQYARDSTFHPPIGLSCQFHDSIAPIFVSRLRDSKVRFKIEEYPNLKTAPGRWYVWLTEDKCKADSIQKQLVSEIINGKIVIRK